MDLSTYVVATALWLCALSLGIGLGMNLEHRRLTKIKWPN
jgi:hypothetical protein